LKKLSKTPISQKDKSGQKCGLKRGLQTGLDKLNVHLEKALVGDYPLGAGMACLICMVCKTDVLGQFYTLLSICHTSRILQNGMD
jgi:hypothetical protein